MYDMTNTTVSIRELQQNLKQVLARVEGGGVIEVTRHGRPVARLSPIRASAPLTAWPDLDTRAGGVFGDRSVGPPGPSEVIVDGRRER